MSVFHIETCNLYKTSTLRLEGPLDVYTSPQLGASLFELEQRGTERIEVDLSKISDVDSTGIRVILGSHKRLSAQHRSIWIVGASKPVRRILGALGMAACVSA